MELLIDSIPISPNIMRIIGQTVRRSEIESHAQDAVNLRLFTSLICPCSGGNIMGIPSPIKCPWRKNKTRNTLKDFWTEGFKLWQQKGRHSPEPIPETLYFAGQFLVRFNVVIQFSLNFAFGGIESSVLFLRLIYRSLQGLHTSVYLFHLKGQGVKKKYSRWGFCMYFPIGFLLKRDSQRGKDRVRGRPQSNLGKKWLMSLFLWTTTKIW